MFGNLTDNWLGNNAPDPQSGNTEVRGMDTARLISARAIYVVFTRPSSGTTDYQLPPQMVRVEMYQGVRQVGEVRNDFLNVSRQYINVIGDKDNPLLPDTDLQRGDTFFYGGLQWEIKDFIPTVPGRLLASGEVTP